MTQDELDEMLERLQTADLDLQAGLLLSVRGDQAASESHLRAALRGVEALGDRLRSLGAVSVKSKPWPTLDLLQLDTPDTRELLAGLEALVPVAERIDRARGRVVALRSGKTFPGDLGAQLGQLKSRVALEVRGPGGGVTGGLE